LDKLNQVVSDMSEQERSLNDKIRNNETESKRLWEDHKDK